MNDSSEYLAVARVVAAHGVQGEVRCEVMTDFPERFRRTATLYHGKEHVAIAVERARLVKDAVVLKLAGVDSRTDAEGLRGLLLYVPVEAAVALPAGTYFWHQIIGLRVVTVDGRELGAVADILATGSNDVYIVRGEGGEILLPAIRDVIQEIDLVAGQIRVELIEGLG